MSAFVPRGGFRAARTSLLRSNLHDEESVCGSGSRSCTAMPRGNFLPLRRFNCIFESAKLMPRICTICAHASRDVVERALLAQEPYRNIAARFGTSTSALVRHRQEHLAIGLVKAHEVQEVVRADSLLDDVRSAEGRAERLYGAAEGILERALEAKDLKTALVAIRAATGVMGEARKYMELRGELSGELGAPGQVQLDWHQQIMIMALPRCSDTPEQIERAARMGLPDRSLGDQR